MIYRSKEEANGKFREELIIEPDDEFEEPGEGVMLHNGFIPNSNRLYLETWDHGEGVIIALDKHSVKWLRAALDKWDSFLDENEEKESK